jgi:hypothetical protein
MLDESKLAQITELHHGGHRPNAEGRMCAMEAVAYIAGEPWSDTPQCASPVISAFMSVWNDGLPDAERTTLLLPLIPRLVGTRGDEALEERRSLMAADWLVRVHTPAWLRLAKLDAQAELLERLPEITSMAQVPSRPPHGPPHGTPQGPPHGPPHGTPHGPPHGAAAWDAAWDAAGAAAGAAAWAAAWDAARAAAWAAAWGRRGRPRCRTLQQSAVALVIRMVEAGA